MNNDILISEKNFPFKDLLETDYFKNYKQNFISDIKYQNMNNKRNYHNLLKYINEIYEYNEQHANSFAKRLKNEIKDKRNSEAIFSEIIVYRYYIRLVYEEIIKSIQIEKDNCDLIIEKNDRTLLFFEIFCIMPNFKEPTEENKVIIQDVKTHTQEEFSSIRQKLINKINKQNQMTQKRNNYVIIELNDSIISGDFNILSSLSGGYKIYFNPETKEKLYEGYDWSNSIFNDKITKYIKGIIYFSLGNYNSRKIITNQNFNK